MRRWALMLGGLLIWAAHFFLAYAFASIFPGRDLARWLTLAATVAALAGNAAVLRLALRPAPPEELQRSQARIGAVGALLSLIAVAWQSFPIIF